MALVKNKTLNESVENTIFDDHIQAQKVFKDTTLNQEQRIEALEYLLNTQSVSHILKLVNSIFNVNEEDNHIFIDIVFNSFKGLEKTDEDYENFTKSLQSDNVFLRNTAIKYLQQSSEESTIFLNKLLKNSDKDLRIFAINILGDVQYEKSVEMLRYFIAQENDINAMMTAVDYLGEVGSKDDIPLLETLLISHKDDTYVVFGVQMAIDRIKG